MIKKLTRVGDDVALILDRSVLDATGMDAETAVAVSTAGDVIVVAPRRDAERTEGLRGGLEEIHQRHGGAFRRLAGGGMGSHSMTIPYSDELLLSLGQTPEEFEAEARQLLAVKLYELDRLTTGRAAELAGVGRAEFMLLLGRFGSSPVGVDPEELEQDRENA